MSTSMNSCRAIVDSEVERMWDPEQKRKHSEKLRGPGPKSSIANRKAGSSDVDQIARVSRVRLLTSTALGLLLLLLGLNLRSLKGVSACTRHIRRLVVSLSGGFLPSFQPSVPVAARCRCVVPQCRRIPMPVSDSRSRVVPATAPGSFVALPPNQRNNQRVFRDRYSPAT